jgi:uncharacterized membrane protein YfcA
MDHFFGYAAALMIGISLALVGGGGSIITLPVLVYLFHISPTMATVYSLFIVGCTSLFGGIKETFDGFVDFKTSLIFVAPCVMGVYFGRHFLTHHIPESIILWTGPVTKDDAIMIFFGVLMLIASISMLRQNDYENQTRIRGNFSVLFLSGFFIGVVTGVVGVGGGFLIIPSLILFARLSMKSAVATSLVIISVKSFVGFIGDVQSTCVVDFAFLSIFSTASVIGFFIGNHWSKFIDGRKLKKGFAWCLLIGSLSIISAEFWR